MRGIPALIFFRPSDRKSRSQGRYLSHTKEKRGQMNAKTLGPIAGCSSHEMGRGSQSRMLLWDISFSSPAENIVFDDLLLRLAEQGDVPEMLRFWESPEVFVVLGRTGELEREVNRDALLRDHIQVVRRSSGGGTVLQGPGCLNFSWVLPKAKDPALQDIRQSYQKILSTVQSVLKSCGITSEFRPISDLILQPGERKFSGNAQRRTRTHLLHHGTLLYDFDLTLIERYLPVPADCPAYRQRRPHRDFVANAPLRRADFKKAFRAVNPASSERTRLDQPLIQALAEMVAKKNFFVDI